MLHHHNTNTNTTPKKEKKTSPHHPSTKSHKTKQSTPHRHTTHQKLIYINFSLFFFYRQLRRLENRETKQRDQTTHKEKQKRGEKKKT